jgi:Domain of unknown function (DUF4157)
VCTNRVHLLIAAAVFIGSGALAQNVFGPESAAQDRTSSGITGNGFEALDPGARRLLVPVLVAGITSFRDAAIERGVSSIPRDIRDALLGYLPSDLLDSVRWRVDDGLSTQHTLFLLGDTPAMTLGHVVVFAHAEDTDDPTLWAHELFHALQYRRWGIDGFAERYLADYGAVEFEAAEFRWQWMRATGRTPRPNR